MTTDTKPTNPKDAFGSAKVPLGLCPSTAQAEWALAQLEGALKYGRFNWRIAGVRASIYSDAILRHHGKWYNGQNRDPMTKVHELASIMACCAILIDSEVLGMLEDDRPPMAPLGELLDINMAVVAHLKDLFKDHSPFQATIVDTPGLKVEGFPDGYDANADTTGCADEGCPHYGYPHSHAYTIERGPPDANGKVDTLVVRMTPPAPAVSAVHQPQPLFLECGCTKRCKGHAVDGSAPGNYAAERAAPATQTHDAEFPHAPAAYTETKAFDPAD